MEPDSEWYGKYPAIGDNIELTSCVKKVDAGSVVVEKSVERRRESGVVL